MKPRLPLGVKVLAVLFALPAVFVALTAVVLIWPGTFIERFWYVNDEARSAFQLLGPASALLKMCVAALAYSLTAIGLALGKAWGRWLAIVILSMNVLLDSVAAVVTHKLVVFASLPIYGGLIFYLAIKAKAFRVASHNASVH